MGKAPRLVISAWIACLLWACSAPDPIIGGDAHPAMWEVSDGDTTFTLIGSVHQLPPQLNWQDRRVLSAMAHSDELWLELAPREYAAIPALFDAVSSDESVASIDQRIGRARAEQVIDQLNQIGIDEGDAQAMESWAIAMSFGAVAGNDAGLARENGVEDVLTAAFQRTSRPIIGLESAASQFAAFDALSPAVQDRMLAMAVDDAADTRPRLVRLLGAWARGDFATFSRLVSVDVDRLPALKQSVVTMRNREWATRLDQRARAPGRVMVAVGAGHMVGDDGLPALLRQAGFTVRRIP